MQFFHQTLLTWFHQYGRDLPWRHAPGPYQVWVSEIMLQQTQVATVIPYYERWMMRFPDILSLAQASVDEVLTLWAGLGYYRRARYLHEGARAIVEQYGGKFPQTLENLRKIPGIGPYTAGAIASFAFGQNVPAIDGNAERVLSRYFGIFGDLTRGEGKKNLSATGHQLADLGNSSDINQAIMDIGSSCCSRIAQCEQCPLHSHCYALKHGLTQTLPQKKQAIEKYDEYRVALCLSVPNGSVLLARRRPHILLGGLWEYPMVTIARGKHIAPPNLRLPRKNMWSEWLSAHHPNSLLTNWTTHAQQIEHIFTHIHMRVTLDMATLKDMSTDIWTPDETYDAFEWHQPNEVELLPISSLMQKLMGQHS